MRLRVSLIASLLLLGIGAMLICFSLTDPKLLVEDDRHGLRGDGAANAPYIIETPEDLMAFRDAVNAGDSFAGRYVLQSADIDLTNHEDWVAIGEFGKGCYFKGVYDGGGHVINGVSCSADENNGLFGYLCGQVFNLGVAGDIGGAYVGGIASHGSGDARIVNCFNAASVAGRGRAGGIADNFAGEIVLCVNVGEVSSQIGIAGGIASYDAGSVEYCYSVGTECVTEGYGGSLKGSVSGDANGLVAFLADLYVQPDVRDFTQASDVDIIPLVWSDDGLAFGSSISTASANPDQGVLSGLLGWLPIAFLAIVAAIGLAFAVSAHSISPFSKKSRELNFDNIRFDGDGKERMPKASIVASAALMVCLVIVGGASLNHALTLKRDDGVLTMKNFYSQPSGTVDVLLLGSSQAGLSLDVEELWSEHGISGYALWGSVQPLWNSYYYLKEALKTGKPAVVVLETREATRDFEYSDEGRQYANTFGMAASDNKFRAIQVSASQDRWLDLVLGFPIYHGRYGELVKSDFVLVDSISYKGGWSRYGSAPIEPGTELGVINATGLPTKQGRYLKAISTLCKENGIPLVLVSTPSENREHIAGYNNVIRQLAEEEGVPFLDFNLLDDETGFDSSSDFYLDGVHLNTRGARKISDYLARYLQEGYEVIDHRGDAAYGSWDEFAQNTQNTYIGQITDVHDYLAELARDGRTVVFVKRGIDASAESFDGFMRESASTGFNLRFLGTSSNGCYVIEDSSDLATRRFEPFESRELSLEIDGCVIDVSVSGDGEIAVDGKTFGSVPANSVTAIVLDDDSGLIDVCRIFGGDSAGVVYDELYDIVYFRSVEHLEAASLAVAGAE